MSPPLPFPDGLLLDRVARRFGGRWAVAGVSYELAAGRALMITGANGSGKTTLLRCIATALQVHHGAIRFAGRDVWASRGVLRDRIGLLSHATRLYEDLSAADNLRVWARLGGYEADVRGLLERVGLPADRNDPVRTFSAGMRRRAALALALVKRPDLVLLDEPFAALDPTGRAVVGDVLSDLRAQGATLVLATHLPGVAARWADEALHLEQGRITWSGTAAEAAARAEVL